MLGGQQLQQDVLRVVRVLVLVDEHVAERLRPALARLGEALEDVHGQHQQVVEVDRVRGEEAALVEAVDVGDRLVVEARDARSRTPPGRSAGSSRSRSACGCRAATKRFGSRSSSSRQCLDEADLVGLVVDREVRAVAEPLRLAAQDPAAGGVEGEDPDRAGDAAPSMPSIRSRISPAALFVNVIARISFGSTPLRREQVRDAVGEHARLPRARAGDHEQRPLGGRDGLALGVVQVGEVRLGLRDGPPA